MQPSIERNPFPITVQQNLPPENFDFIITSIDYLGTPGNLNRMVMKTFGYDSKSLPSESQLRAGFFLLSEKGRKPILFVVSMSNEGTIESLQKNLNDGLLTYRSDLAGKKVWMPLMGTGAGGIDFQTSYNITTEVLSRVGFEELTTPPEIAISVSKSEEGDNLMRELNLPLYEQSLQPNSEENPMQYWILKMGASWQKLTLKEDEPIIFGTKDYQGESIANEQLERIQNGDIVLGYFGHTAEQIFGEMKVAQSPDIAYGTPFIRLMLTKSFQSPIPFHKFRDLSTGLSHSLKAPTPYEQFIPISEAEYNSIIDLIETPFVNNYIPYYLTEGDHKATEDQLDFEADIDSLATVICLKSVKPPLAIGLFGNWGSGKSFFMEKLQERIEKISASSFDGYMKNIVSVRFNSWHYSDANLWASMILQIFESMNAWAAKTQTGTAAVQEIYKKLNVTRAQIEETELKIAASIAEQETIKSKQKALEAKLAAERKTLSLWTANELGQLIFADPQIRNELADIKKEFQNEELDENIIQLRGQLRTVDGVWNQMTKAFQFLKKERSAGIFWLCVGLVIFMVMGSILIIAFRDKIQEYVGGLTLATTAMVASLAGVIRILQPGFKYAGKLFDYLKGFVTRFEAQQSKKEIEARQVTSELSESVKAMEAEQQTLEEQKMQAKNTLKTLQDKLNEIGSGRALASFLSSKSKDNTYISQLGIISWIRKDFEQLNNEFIQQKEANDNAPMLVPSIQIDRIVLYIDDLDRCNEDVVVNVLEAIHLLLAFPLFVVVVGVDPRWLNNALTMKYSGLFGAGNKEKMEQETVEHDLAHSTSLGRIATSYDYLEKIFQIPFALKPINKSGREKLIKYLLKDELAGEEQTKTKAKEVASTLKNNANNTEAKIPESPSGSNVPADELVVNTIQPQEGIPASATQEPIAIPKRKLEITDEELAYMQQIAALFGNTPRTINRYVNIYRIIKAHGGLKVNGPYERDEFLPILFVLAVIVGFPEQSEEFIRLTAAAPETQTCQDFLSTCGIAELPDKALPLLGQLSSMHVKYLQLNLPLIARFSFRTLMRDEG